MRTELLVWACLALALIAAETLVPGAFLLWLGLAAAGVFVMVTVLPDLNILIQVVSFVLLSFASILIYRRWFRLRGPTDAPVLNRRADQLIGREVALHQAIADGKKVLFEGAQAAMLDVDHGTYPYTTSSNTVAGQVSAGAGVSATAMGRVLGIVKAYTTRVGGGPFPTELDINDPGSVGHHLSTVGHERGTVTGRARRCGWLDIPALRRAVLINGLSGVCLTKLDVLDGLSEIKVAVGYRLGGQRVDILPLDADDIAACQPIYETFAGWSESTVGLTRWEQLPLNAQRYLEHVQQWMGAPIDMVSTGPDREHTILLRHPYGA